MPHLTPKLSFRVPPDSIGPVKATRYGLWDGDEKKVVVLVLVVLVALVVVVLVVVVVVAYGLWDGDEKKVIVFLGVHVRAGAGTGFIKVATLRLQCRYLEAAYQIGS